jgi:hypothetical protein
MTDMRYTMVHLPLIPHHTNYFALPTDLKRKLGIGYSKQAFK